MHENSKNSFFTVGVRSGRVPAQRHSDREIGRLSRTDLVQYYLKGFHTKIPHFSEIWPNIPMGWCARSVAWFVGVFRMVPTFQATRFAEYRLF